jgi:hypothetical protein
MTSSATVSERPGTDANADASADASRCFDKAELWCASSLERIDAARQFDFFCSSVSLDSYGE